VGAKVEKWHGTVGRGSGNHPQDAPSPLGSKTRLRHDRDLLILIAVAVIENFGYRQINNWWRVVGWWQFLRKKQGGGEMKRKGFAVTSKSA
jgi:hypothetical protein